MKTHISVQSFTPIPCRSLTLSCAALIALVIGMSGCLAMDMEDEYADIGVVQNNVLAENALSENALSMNALSTSALVSGELPLNYASAGTLHTSSLGRQLLKYVSRCAYSATDYLHVDDSNGLGVDNFPGRLGLATTWKNGGLDDDYKELMTACLLAHLNKFGVPVSISVRYSGAMATPNEESAVYFYGDGVFYGNLYASPPREYACSIRQKSGEVPAATSDFASLRVCDEGATNCGVTYVGYCDEVCSTIVEDNHQFQFASCHDGNPDVASRQYYQHTFSVWLPGTDAPACQPGNPLWKGYTCRP